MTNLLEETLDKLKSNHKTWEDVEFIDMIYNEYEPTYYGDYDLIGQKRYRLDKETFLKSAKDIDYDESWGGREINETLKIVGKDWWLERAEYDGREWWEFKQKPKLDENVELLKNEEAMKGMILQKELEEDD